MNINQKLNQFGNFLVAPIDELKKSIKGTLPKSHFTTQKVASLALATFLMISTLSLSYFLGKFLLSKAIPNSPSSITVPKLDTRPKQPNIQPNPNTEPSRKPTPPPLTGGASSADSKLPAPLDPKTVIAPLPRTDEASSADSKPVTTGPVLRLIGEDEFDVVIGLKNTMIQNLYDLAGSHITRQQQVRAFQQSLDGLEEKNEKNRAVWIKIITGKDGTGKDGINHWLSSTYTGMPKDKYPTVGLLAYLNQEKIIRPYKKALTPKETVELKDYIKEAIAHINYMIQLELKNEKPTPGRAEALIGNINYLNPLKEITIFNDGDIKSLYDKIREFSASTGFDEPEPLAKIKQLLSNCP